MERCKVTEYHGYILDSRGRGAHPVWGAFVRRYTLPDLGDFSIPVLVWSQAKTRCDGPTIASSEAQVVTLELPTGLPLPPWQSPSCCQSNETRLED